MLMDYVHSKDRHLVYIVTNRNFIKKISKILAKIKYVKKAIKTKHIANSKMCKSEQLLEFINHNQVNSLTIRRETRLCETRVKVMQRGSETAVGAPLDAGRRQRRAVINSAGGGGGVQRKGGRLMLQFLAAMTCSNPTSFTHLH